jgi:putative membrane-bound dehydrogenase-like protein
MNLSRTPVNAVLCKALFMCCLFLLACESGKKIPPLSPDDALKTFQLPDGFRIELVASDPLISDPVEIAFDEDGFLYVVEMEDYPANAAPGGRIMMLEDVDGNGHYEKGDVFADSLPYVNGVFPWRGGVLVTSAPDIIFLKDTTGDRRADIHEVVITGFAFTNPQLRVSSLRYGIDNWIYGAYSRSGGQRGYPEFTNHGSPLKFPANPLKDSADIYPGNDFRFIADSFKIEPAGGMSQFGMAFDAEGNRFTVWNNVHLRHVVIDGRYAARNPWLNISSVMAPISDHGDAATVYSRAENRLNLHESEIGHFTSACGHSVYTGDLFEPRYAGAAFICEPVSNIVHLDLLTRKGATFSASRLEDGKEFLSSTDSWFRPVNTTVGPDGGLYVVDFYRKLVEHPAWIARADDKGIYTHAGVLQEKDFLEGNDRGRIYRIVPEDFRRDDSMHPRLGKASSEQLVQHLTHGNMWWRINAQRLLVDRQDTSVIPSLRKLIIDSGSSQAKIHALRTLDGLRALDDALLLSALRDKDPSVKKHAVLLAEPRLEAPDLKEQVLSMAGETDDALQFQIASTLSLLPSEVSFPHLHRIAVQRVADEWFHNVILLSARENVLDWYRSVVSFIATDETKEGKEKLLKRIASIAGRRNQSDEISDLVMMIAAENDTSAQRAALQGIAEGLPSRDNRVPLSTKAQDSLITLITSRASDVQVASLDLAEKIQFQRWTRLAKVMGERINVALDAQASPHIRAQGVRILGLKPDAMPTNTFEELLRPTQPREVQAAAARVLSLKNEEAAFRLLSEHFNTSTPEVRAIIESAFARSVDRMSVALAAMEQGRIDPALLSPQFRSRLVQHPEKAIGQRAAKLVANVSGRKRDDVVNSYYESTILKGSVARGKDVFSKTCTVCHQMEGAGRPFGPDLLSVSNQTRINLLTMILDPNNNIAPGYDGYFIETSEGRTLSGILGNETSSGVMLHTPDGKEETIRRDNIVTLRPMTTSLMPEGLEAGLTKQDIADLLEYLKNGKSTEAK